MDEFYYDNNTKILLNTPGVIIGNTSLQLTNYDVKLQQIKDIKLIPKTKVLGVTVEYEDKIKENVNIKHSLKNIDINDYLQLSETYVPKNRDLSIIL